MMDVDAIILYQLTNKPDDTTYITVYNPNMAPLRFCSIVTAVGLKFVLNKVATIKSQGGGGLSTLEINNFGWMNNK